MGRVVDSAEHEHTSELGCGPGKRGTGESRALKRRDNAPRGDQRRTKGGKGRPSFGCWIGDWDASGLAAAEAKTRTRTRERREAVESGY